MVGSTTTPVSKAKTSATPDPGCTAPAGKHGTAAYAEKYRCTCRDALRALKRKRLGLPNPNPPVLLHPIGTARRIQAANVAGWSARDIAGLLQVSQQRVLELRSCKWAAVTLAVAEQVQKVVEYLLTLPPPVDGPGRGNNGPSRTRNHAARQGWAPLDAWLPDEIDDPLALSDLAYQRAGSTAPPAGAEYLEKIEFCGYTVESLAAERGVNPTTIQDVVTRHRRRAKAQGARRCRVSPAQLEQARARIANGARHREIAAELGVSRSYLSNLLAARGRTPTGLAGSGAGRTTSRPPTTASHQEGHRVA